MIVQTEAVAIGYRGTPVVRDITMSLAAGDVLAIVGTNGSGKSTLVKTLLGVLPPIAGHIHWGRGRPREIAYMGQITEFDRRFPLRVRDLAAMGAWNGLGLIGAIGRQKRALIDDALERTGLVALADRSLHELSSGQLQRALFARTMVQDAPLIFLDEPFAAVDQATEAALLGLIDDWAGEGRAIALVLHDLSAVLQHCSSALLLGAGQALFGAPRAVLTPKTLVAQGYMAASHAAWIEAMYAGPPDQRGAPGHPRADLSQSSRHHAAGATLLAPRHGEAHDV